MRPAVPERHTRQARSALPQGAERVEKGFQDLRSRYPPTHCACAQGVEQTARPRGIAAREYIGPRLQHGTEPIQQTRASFQSDQLIFGAGLKRVPEGFRVGLAQNRRVHSERIVPTG